MQTVFLGVIAAFCLLAAIGAFQIVHRRRQRLTAGTVPVNFPPESLLPVSPNIQAANKLGNTGAFGSTVFFTAPVSGWYLLGWAVHIVQTDAAGTITAAFLPPHSVAIPGVQAAPATPSDGKGPAAAYYMAAGETVTGSVTVGSLTGTTFDVWLFAMRMS